MAMTAPIDTALDVLPFVAVQTAPQTTRPAPDQSKGQVLSK